MKARWSQRRYIIKNKTINLIVFHNNISNSNGNEDFYWKGFTDINQEMLLLQWVKLKAK